MSDQLTLFAGGYPCQPFSTAGKRAGKDDDRHLWPEFSRLVDELRPAWVIGENVAGHISMGLDDVLSDLEGKGYACRSFVIPACGVGAPHKRERVWTVAHAHGVRGDGSAAQQGPNRRQVAAGSGDVSHASGVGRQGQGQPFKPVNPETTEDGQATELEHGGVANKRLAESGMGGIADGVSAWLDGSWERGIARVASGVPDRVARLKALGNAVVPQIPEMIGRAILAAEAVP
jgi:DNA (cytosine-5)-methyltransferase 1